MDVYAPAETVDVVSAPTIISAGILLSTSSKTCSSVTYTVCEDELMPSVNIVKDWSVSACHSTDVASVLLRQTARRSWVVWLV